PEELRKENHSGSSTLERQENVYYASSMAVIPIGKWKNEGDAPTAEKASVPSRIYIQKAASPNRELAREEAKNWSYNLSRPVTLAFDPGSSSFPYKVLLGPYQSREDAEADKWRLQTEGFVMDISRKGWNILPVE
ncbi:MAG: SPOR domain-containing protein, partial [Chlamydiia bacterium]|nr:SPOR domain-containing protein [Chlamydiia bacterium]